MEKRQENRQEKVAFRVSPLARENEAEQNVFWETSSF